MAATVCILSGNHLCNNPRVIKESEALARAGYRVVVLGVWFDPVLKARDQSILATIPVTFRPVVDFTCARPLSSAHWLLARAGSKAARWAQDMTGMESPLALGPIVGALDRCASATNAELYIAHSEAALLVGRKLLRLGRRVAVDMEDWFSEDLLPQARKHRPIRLLRELEREILRRGAYASSPSSSMSEALAREYAVAPPIIVYNAFAWSDRAKLDGRLLDRGSTSIPSIYWFSQTLGEGRGLEDLLAALKYLRHDVEVHLRGHRVEGFDDWLSTRVSKRWRERIRVHECVRNDALLSRIAEHDIGFAGEMKFARNRDLTVSNKMLHYLLGGLAVAASDTAGQREIARQASDAVVLYPSGDPVALAVQLNALLESRERLDRAKAAALRGAHETFCWERQETRLLDAVARAVAPSSIRVGAR